MFPNYIGNGRGERVCIWRHTSLVLAFVFGVCCLTDAGVASAAEAATYLPMKYPAAQIFTLLFLMLGPFKIIAPFSRITKGADAALTRQIALRATLFSSIALLLAALLGERFLSSYGVPLPVLALSAGIILFLVALQSILQQFAPPTPDNEGIAGAAPTPTLSMALTPLAFPTIVTPYGIAAVVVFVAISPDLQGRLIVGAIVLAIMLLNLIVMLTERRILPFLGVLLPILGAVLGVIQVALGLQIVLRSLKALGVL
jgi:multiple antibiotic resistance protein